MANKPLKPKKPPLVPGQILVLAAAFERNSFTRAGIVGSGVYTSSGPVSSLNSIKLVYFEKDTQPYAAQIAKELRTKKAVHKVPGDEPEDEWKNKTVHVSWYTRVVLELRRRENEGCIDPIFGFTPSLNDISRPRCPNCQRQAPVVMMTDKRPKVKKFNVPYCHACNGRLHLMLERAALDLPLLSDEEILLGDPKVCPWREADMKCAFGDRAER